MHEFNKLLDFSKNYKSSAKRISPLKNDYIKVSIDYYFFSISPTYPCILLKTLIKFYYQF